MSERRWQINVSRPVLKRNIETGSTDRPIIVRDYQSDDQRMPYTMAREVEITGPSKVCNGSGHSVWVETDGPITMIDPKPGLDQ